MCDDWNDLIEYFVQIFLKICGRAVEVRSNMSLIMAGGAIMVGISSSPIKLMLGMKCR